MLHLSAHHDKRQIKDAHLSPPVRNSSENGRNGNPKQILRSDVKWAFHIRTTRLTFTIHRKQRRSSFTPFYWSFTAWCLSRLPSE